MHACMRECLNFSELYVLNFAKCNAILCSYVSALSADEDLRSGRN